MRLPLGAVNRLARDGGHQQRGSGENLDDFLLFQAHNIFELGVAKTGWRGTLSTDFCNGLNG